MGVLTVMDMARQGLNAARAGMQVVSRNISNSSDPNYSRQDIQFESPATGGVDVWTVRSMLNSYVEARLRAEGQTQGQLETERRLLSDVVSVFGNTSSGLSASLGSFFSSVSALATTPEGVPERNAMVFNADSLAQEFQHESGTLDRLASQLDGEAQSILTKVNQLTTKIAELNVAVAGSSNGSTDQSMTGQLVDQRNTLTRELTGLVGGNAFEDGNGNTTVVIGGGIPLVEGANHFDLQLTGGQGYTNHPGISIVMPSGGTLDVSNRIASGSLGGVLRVRDQVIPQTIATLDRIAGTLNYQFNRVHQQGFGLDNSTNQNFFSPLTASVMDNRGNTGKASVTATITNMAAVTLDDYEVTFTTPGTFDIKNTTTGATVSTGNAYVSGMSVTVGGVQITLSNGSTAPQSGDRFSISTTRGQAANIARSLTDINKIAASSTLAGVPGNNTNALALSALETTKFMNNGLLTLAGGYTSMVTQVGLDQQAVERSYTSQGFVMDSLKQRRAEASGVSLDEEATRLIEFQNTYQASSRLIKIADEMLQTIIQMV